MRMMCVRGRVEAAVFLRRSLEVMAGEAIRELEGERVAGRLVKGDECLDQPAVGAHSVDILDADRRAVVGGDLLHIPAAVHVGQPADTFEHHTSLPPGPAIVAPADKRGEAEQPLAHRVQLEERLPPTEFRGAEAERELVVVEPLEIAEHCRLGIGGDLETDRLLEPQHSVPPAAEIVRGPEAPHLGGAIARSRQFPERNEAVVLVEAVEQVLSRKAHRGLEVGHHRGTPGQIR